MRHLRAALPAAILGTLASTLTAAPATASEAATGALDRVTLTGARSLPLTAPVPETHTVRPGDTVWAIARKYGLRTADVIAWNHLGASSVIQPGQVLRLTTTIATTSPAPAPAALSHSVAKGDTVYAIAQQHGTTVSAILAANGLSGDAIIYPGQTITIPGASPAAPASTAPTPPPAAAVGTTHTVTQGDTVFAIAKKHGSTVSAILAANSLSPASIIYPGQNITIPGTVSTASTASAQSSAALNAPQAENAAMIIRIGRELGVPDRGIAIALATSMVESWMRNLDWGDRDSLGLFQQRPSTGWGTAEQIRNRGHSIRAFYGGPSDPNGTTTRGLLDIPGWESMSFSDAAQAVQISAHPDRYGQWEQAAYAWLAQHG